MFAAIQNFPFSDRSMVSLLSRNPIPFQQNQIGISRVDKIAYNLFPFKEIGMCPVNCSQNQSGQHLTKFNGGEQKIVKKFGKKEHHLWKKRDSAGSGTKALNLVRIVSGLPDEKEAVYGALDKWTAWEVEFPAIAAAKALQILRKRNQWKRVIQVAKWMFGKGQGMTMTTFDTLLLAFDMDNRVDEAESFWNMILHTHTRSISKKLFSRMISLYAHHNMPEKVIEVFGDMEELGVKPDEDTVRKVACAFRKLGESEKQNMVVKNYLGKWKYIHFKGERVRVRREWVNEDDTSFAKKNQEEEL